MQSLYTAATGMRAAELNIDVIANNLANQNTTAFKRRRVEFESLLYIDKQQVGAQSSDVGTIRPVGISVGLGVKTSATYPVLEQGPLQETEAPLDLAIDGGGLFRIILPNGDEAYTRAGAFQLSSEGEIVTEDGYTVSPGITVTEDVSTITVNDSGEVIGTDSQLVSTVLGQFEIVKFLNQAGLEALGNNLFAETEASGASIDGVAGDEGFGSVLQGFIEGSNVNAVIELTDLIRAQRAFEFNVKVLEKADQTSQVFSQSV